MERAHIHTPHFTAWDMGDVRVSPAVVVYDVMPGFTRRPDNKDGTDWRCFLDGEPIGRVYQVAQGGKKRLWHWSDTRVRPDTLSGHADSLEGALKALKAAIQK